MSPIASPPGQQWPFVTVSGHVEAAAVCASESRGNNICIIAAASRQRLAPGGCGDDDADAPGWRLLAAAMMQMRQAGEAAADARPAAAGSSSMHSSTAHSRTQQAQTRVLTDDSGRLACWLL